MSFPISYFLKSVTGGRAKQCSARCGQGRLQERFAGLAGDFHPVF
jgi:hypothetical protein